MLPVPETYVGARLRWLVFATALLEMPWCGMYFGWAPIQFIMKDEDYFILDCRNETSTRTVRSAGMAPSNSSDPCVQEQDRIFNWLYLTADITNYLTTYFFGLVYDLYGSRTMRLLCNFFLFSAAAFGSIARPGTTEFLYYPMMFCLGLGSIPLFLTNLQIGQLFENSDLVLSLINGIYDAGDGLTIVPKLMHEHYGWPVYYWWHIFAVATGFFALRTFFLMPKQFFTKIESTSNSHTESVPLKQINPTPEQDSKPSKPQNPQESSTSNNNTQVQTITQAGLFRLVATWRFAIFIPWFLVMDLRQKFFLQSVNPWLNWLGDDDLAFTSRHTDIFSVLQLTALLCAPFSGLVMSAGRWYYTKYHNITDTSSQKRFSLVWLFLIISVLTCCFSWMASFKVKSDAWTICIFMLCIFTRTNMYTIWNIWTLVEFPPNAFGRLSGVVVFILGLFSASQQLFLRIAQRQGWQEVQLGFAVFVLATGVLEWFCYRRHSIRMHAALGK